jgi:rhodanese-related sulfurtransferase
LNLPSSEVDVEAMTWLAASDPTVIVYASTAHQRQAGVVADKLIEMGCKKVLVLHGGIEGWKELGLPTESQAGR